MPALSNFLQSGFFYSALIGFPKLKVMSAGDWSSPVAYRDCKGFPSRQVQRKFEEWRIGRGALIGEGRGHVVNKAGIPAGVVLKEQKEAGAMQPAAKKTAAPEYPTEQQFFCQFTKITGYGKVWRRRWPAI